VIHPGLAAGAAIGRAADPEPDTGANRHGNPQFMTSLARGLLVMRAFSGLRRGRTMPTVIDAMCRHGRLPSGVPAPLAEGASMLE
jgi:hypothetical protein